MSTATVSVLESEFQKISQKIQERKIWVYDQLNEDNPKEAREEFYRDSTLVHPNFTHDREKVIRLFQQFYDLQGEIAREIRDSNCTETEKKVLEEMRTWSLKSNQQAIRVIAHTMPDLEEFLREEPELACHSCFEKALQCASCTMNFRQWTLKPADLQIGSQEYYGYTVNRDLLLALLHNTLEHMTSHMDSWSDADRKILQEVKQILSHYGLDEAWLLKPQLAALIYYPSKDTMRRFGELAKSKLEPILRHFPHKDGIYTAEDVVQYTNEIFAQEYPGQTNYHGVVDEKRHIFSVSQREREARVPRERSKGPIDYATLCASWGGHELAVHAGRGIPYENVEIKEFSIGFTSYEGTEEGIAKCIEKSLLFLLGDVGNQANRSAIDYYVNIGLADQFGMNYRDLWTLRQDIIYLSTVCGDADERAKQMKHASDNAYDQVRRVFRGTGDVIDYKDLFYYVAEERIWRLIEAYLDWPDELWFTLTGLGKVNILDEDTRNLLRVIVDSDDFPLTKAQLTRENPLTMVFSFECRPEESSGSDDTVSYHTDGGNRGGIVTVV